MAVFAASGDFFSSVFFLLFFLSISLLMISFVSFISYVFFFFSPIAGYCQQTLWQVDKTSTYSLRSRLCQFSNFDSRRRIDTNDFRHDKLWSHAIVLFHFPIEFMNEIPSSSRLNSYINQFLSYSYLILLKR